MNLGNIYYLLWGAVITLILFLLRDIIVKITLPKTMPRFDLTIIKRMLPKGLVGAALISIIGIPIVKDITYSIILSSIIFTSLFIFLSKRKISKELVIQKQKTVSSDT